MAGAGAGAEAEAEQPSGGIRGRHIKKRALKNKSLSVSFDEKDLKDFVTGFHKRKKKRRKEAQQKLQEAERRKRIEARKKAVANAETLSPAAYNGHELYGNRKLERELAIYGGAPPDSSAGPDESDYNHDESEEEEPTASVSGTTMYDNGDMKVTVTTSEISREEEYLAERPLLEAPRFVGGPEKKRNQVPVSKKKQFKKVARKKSHPKTQSKRDKRKGKSKMEKH